jgi:hypothetical protein
MTATTLRGNGKRRGTFPRSGRPRNGIGPANRTSPAEPASSGTGQPAVQPPTASWRSGIGEREPRPIGTRAGPWRPASSWRRSRIRMNEHPRRAVDPIVSGSPDPPGDGSIDRQGPKRSTRQADSKPRSFIDIYLSRRRSKVIEQFADAVTWPLRDSATRRSGDPVMWRQVHMTM